MSLVQASTALLAATSSVLSSLAPAATGVETPASVASELTSSTLQVASVSSTVITNPAVPEVTAFLPDIEVPYDWANANYTGGPKNTTSFNLTYEWCEDFYDNTFAIRPDLGGIGLYRFFNACIAYANITYDYVSGERFSGKFEQTLEKYSISEADYQKNPYASAVLADNITDSAFRLLAGACILSQCSIDIPDKKDDPCSAENLLFNSTINGVTLTRLHYDNNIKCQAQICKRSQDLVTDDPDIGGVGVFLSYAFLVMIAILLIIGCVFEWFIPVVKGYDMPRESYFRSEPYVNVLLNFHKTQVFFTGSLVVAAFIKSKSGSVSLLDQFLLQVVSLQGIALISFTMLPVYMVSKRSYYVYFLSLVSYILCLVFCIVALRGRYDGFGTWGFVYGFCWDYFQTENFIGGSEKNSNNTLDFLAKAISLPPGLLIAIMVWCTVIMIGAGIYQIKAHRQLPGTVRGAYIKKIRTLNALVGLVVIIVYTLIVGLNVWLLTKFWKVIDHHKWGFGQVVAVGVWIPVVMDWGNDQYHAFKDKFVENNRKSNPAFGIVSDESVTMPQKSAGTWGVNDDVTRREYEQAYGQLPQRDRSRDPIERA